MMNKYLQKLEDVSENKLGLVLLAVSFILRFSYSLFIYFINVTEHFTDDIFYRNLARAVYNSGKIFYDVSLIDPRYDWLGPGLPWINALTIAIFGGNWLGFFFISSIASALITFFTYKTALLITNKNSALLAGLWSSVYFYYLMFSAGCGKDIWMSLFLIVTVFLLLKLFNPIKPTKFSYFLYLIFTFVFVYSYHLDERFIVFSPIFFLYILLKETGNFKIRVYKKTITFILILLLFMLPWLIHNYIKYNKVIILTNRTEHITDKLLGYEKKEYELENAIDRYDKYIIKDCQIDSFLTGLKTETDGGFVISEKQIQAMVAGKIPRPLTHSEKVWSRFRIFIRPFQIGGDYRVNGYCYQRKSFRNNIVSFLFYGIMLFFSIPGFFFLNQSNKEVFYLFISIIVIYTLSHSFLVPFTVWRYRLPLDSIFIITGSIGIVKIFLTIRKN